MVRHGHVHDLLPSSSPLSSGYIYSLSLDMKNWFSPSIMRIILT
jgi:hypothetical protein